MSSSSAPARWAAASRRSRLPRAAGSRCTTPRRGRPTGRSRRSRRSAAKLAEKGGPDPDEVLGRIEPVDDLVPADLMVEAVVEDLSVKEDIFRRADDDAARRGGPRLEHFLDPDRLARCRHGPAGQGHRHALLQSRAGPEARRGDPRPTRPRTRRPARSSPSPRSSGRFRLRPTTSPGSSPTGS